MGGRDYVGKENLTYEQQPCEPWLKALVNISRGEMDLHLFPDPMDSRHNFCRALPFAWFSDITIAYSIVITYDTQPYCFVLNGDNYEAEPCDIPLCYELLKPNIESESMLYISYIFLQINHS